ncbi:MAG TPA: hypothetical protein VF092_11840 [Longimicrobium sp.]
MIGALVGFVVVAVLAVVALVAVIALLGVVIGVVAGLVGLAFKLLPFLLLGWLAVKLIRRVERPRRGVLSARDRAWLDSPSY